MGKKRGDSKMEALAKNVYDFTPKTKKDKLKSQKTKKMSSESIKSSYDFKRRSWERD